MLQYVVPFVIALVVSYLLTPSVKKLAIKIGAVDRPNARKVHTRVIPRLGGLVITTFNMVLGGLELLALLLLGHIPAVGALYRSLGLDIFADVPFFTGFTLRSALLLCYVGVFCAAIGFLLTAKITEYTSATEASFVYLIKPVLATLLAVVCFHEAISVNRMIGLVFFLAASLCVSVPVLREMRRDAVTAQPPR